MLKFLPCQSLGSKSTDPLPSLSFIRSITSQKMNFPRLTNQKMYKLVLYRMIHRKKHEIDSYSLLITWAHFPIMISKQWLNIRYFTSSHQSLGKNRGVC